MEYPKEGIIEFNTITNTTVVISSTTSTVALATNARRVYARFTNRGGRLIYLGLGVDASKTGGLILARDEIWETTQNGLYRGAINAISNTAYTAQNLRVFEGYTDES